MTISRVKPGDWTVGEVLTSAQQNTLDIDHAKAIDGAGGGDYTPTDDLDIQTPTTKEVVLNSCTFPSAADGGGLDLGGENLTDVDQIVCAGIGCSGPIAGASCSVATLVAAGNSALGTTSSDALTINAKTTAAQRIRSPKGLIQGGDAGSLYQYSPFNYELIYIPPGVAVSASTRWRISTGYVPMTGTQSGEIISFRHLGSGSAITIEDQAGGTIATIGPLGAGNLIRVDIAYDPTATAFVIVDQGYN